MGGGGGGGGGREADKERGREIPPLVKSSIWEKWRDRATDKQRQRHKERQREMWKRKKWRKREREVVGGKSICTYFPHVISTTLSLSHLYVLFVCTWPTRNLCICARTMNQFEVLIYAVFGRSVPAPGSSSLVFHGTGFLHFPASVLPMRRRMQSVHFRFRSRQSSAALLHLVNKRQVV